ncbi:MAG: hypothetical protein Q9213_000683 [Squamulea squamosa]
MTSTSLQKRAKMYAETSRSYTAGEIWEKVRWMAKTNATANGAAQHAANYSKTITANELQSIHERTSWPNTQGELTQGMASFSTKWRGEALSRFTKADVAKMNDKARKCLHEDTVWSYVGHWLESSSPINRPEAKFEAEITEQHLRAFMLKTHEQSMVDALLSDGRWEIGLS